MKKERYEWASLSDRHTKSYVLRASDIRKVSEMIFTNLCANNIKLHASTRNYTIWQPRVRQYNFL